MKKTKLMGALAASALLVSTLVACSGSGDGGTPEETPEAPSSADPTGDSQPAPSAFGTCVITAEPGSISLETLQDGVLTVATARAVAPWWEGDSIEAATGGYEYCLAAEIATAAGIETIVVTEVPWEDLVIEGEENDFDIALAQTAYTPTRNNTVELSGPYYVSHIAVLAKADGEVDVTEDGFRKNLFGYIEDSTGEDTSSAIHPSERPGTYVDLTEMIEGLKAGEIDLAISDVEALAHVAQSSGGELSVVATLPREQDYRAILPADTTNREIINELFERFESTGVFGSLTETWITPVLSTETAGVPVIN